MVPPPRTRASAPRYRRGRRPAPARPPPRPLPVPRPAGRRAPQASPQPADVSSARARRRASPAPASAGGARAEPVEVAKRDRARGKRLARADDDARVRRVEANDEERLAGGDPEPAPLADRVADHAVVAAEHAAVDVHDLARPAPPRASASPRRRNSGPAARSRCPGCRACRRPSGPARGRWRASRPSSGRRAGSAGNRAAPASSRRGNSSGRGRDRPGGTAPAGRPTSAGAHVVAGRHRGGVELARRRKQVGELDRLVAGDAGDRRLAPRIALGERLDHRLAEARLVVEHVVRDAEPRRHLARVVDVLAGAAGAGAMRGGAVVVELQRHADRRRSRRA